MAVFDSNYKLVLASSSPRRSMLLKELGFEFTIQKFDFAEDFPDDLELFDVPIYIAQQKALQIPSEHINNEVIFITSDTVVIHDNEIIGKPKDIDHAKVILKQLSGSLHYVATGCCMRNQENSKTFGVITEVEFAQLHDDEIDYYIGQYAPMDKAGAYGIQEWIGARAVKKINGSYNNVIGLPTCELYSQLKDFVQELM